MSNMTACACGAVQVTPVTQANRIPFVATTDRWHRATECTLRFTLEQLLEAVLRFAPADVRALRKDMETASGGVLPSLEHVQNGVIALLQRGLVDQRGPSASDTFTLTADVHPLVSSSDDARAKEAKAGRDLTAFVE